MQPMLDVPAARPMRGPYSSGRERTEMKRDTRSSWNHNCPKCPASYQSKISLEQHMGIAHSASPKVCLDKRGRQP